MNLPLITLTVEGMKHSMHVALAEYSILMDRQVRQAVEAYCTPENIAAIVGKEVKEALDACVKEEVRNFFGYGRAGRRAVKEAIIERLDQLYPEEHWKGEPE